MQRSWRAFVLTAAVAALPCRVCPGAGETALDKYKDVYENGVARIQAEYKASLAAVPRKYVASLAAIEAALRKAGDLDGLLLVRKERARYAETKDIPESAVVATPAALRKLQTECRTVPGTLELTKSKKIKEFADRYVEVLDALKAKLTRNGTIRDALLVKGEIQRVNDSAPVKAAEFVLADHQAKQIDPPPPEAHTPVEIVKPEPQRPNDARPYRGHWYKLFLERTTWHEAKKRCEDMGGYLACVGSRAESMFLIRCARRQQVWLGGTDEGQEGAWTWVNGEPFTFTEWSDGEPSNTPTQTQQGEFGNEGYLVMRPPAKPAFIKKPRFKKIIGKNRLLGQWNDTAPDDASVQGFICEWDR